MRLAFSLTTALGAGLLLVACGGGGTSTTSPRTSTVGSGQYPTPGGTRSLGEKSRSQSRGGETSMAEAGDRSETSGTGEKSGAQSFVVPHSDNSIPNFGHEGTGTQLADAGSVLKTYLAASSRGNWSEACSALAVTVRKRLQRVVRASGAAHYDCGKALAQFAGVMASSKTFLLTRGLAAFRVSGEKAFALFIGPKGTKYVMPMTSEDGLWRVTQFAPLPYPPGSPASGG